MTAIRAARRIAACPVLLATEVVLDALLQLVRKSLVTRIAVRHGRARYGLLETVRQYAWDKLLERAGEPSATRERHAAYYSELVARLDPAHATTLLSFSGETLSAPVFELLDDAHDNVRVALRWWIDTRRPTEGLVLVRAFGALWQWVGIPVDGRRWMEEVLDLAASPAHAPTVPPALHAHALMMSGVIARLQGDYAKARTFIYASAALWRSLDDPIGMSHALNSVAHDHVMRGEFEQADATLGEAIALGRAAGDPFSLSWSLMILGMLSRAQKDHERAAVSLRESARIARSVERASYRTFAVTRALVQLGRAESQRGASAEATAVFKEVLTSMRDSGLAGWLLAACFDWLAAELGRSGEPVRAAHLFGAGEAQWQRAGARRFPIDERPYDEDVRGVRFQLDEAEFARAWNEGRAMALARVFVRALDEPA